jgi:hypothetical protein
VKEGNGASASLVYICLVLLVVELDRNDSVTWDLLGSLADRISGQLSLGAQMPVAFTSRTTAASAT